MDQPRGPQHFDRNRRPPFREKEREHRINNEIRVPEIRLVGIEQYAELLSGGPYEDGVYRTSDALRMAQDLSLDLVEIAPQASPPVCRIVEYSKFRYELKKRQKAAKANQQVSQMKEIRFGPNTDDHDFNFKLRHAQKFLQEGDKVKAYVQFRGRNIVYKERGSDVLGKFAHELEEWGKIEMEPRMEGRRMIMILTPKKAAVK
ncbi:MAG: translation initiation factor IF-3 [Bacteroidia bacterium]|nr:translation initiation factor IF-3 [Bacteroidia bacterium]